MKLSDRIAVHAWPQEIENVLEQWLGNKSSGECQKGFRPRTNIVERDQEFVISVELPGIDVADVNVEASDDKLNISGEKKFALDADSEKLHRRERATGKFTRSFEFPTQVDFDKITAGYKHGVLSVTVPKSEKVLPKQIQIDISE